MNSAVGSLVGQYLVSNFCVGLCIGLVYSTGHSQSVSLLSIRLQVHVCSREDLNVDFSVYKDISDAETLEMAVINAVWCLVSDIMFILECLYVVA